MGDLAVHRVSVGSRVCSGPYARKNERRCLGRSNSGLYPMGVCECRDGDMSPD